jgi:hypothetical protein
MGHHMYVPFVFRIWDVIFMTIVMIMMIISFGLVLYLYVMRGDKKNGRSNKGNE